MVDRNGATDCRRVERRLKAWLDGELDAALAAAVERHVEACGRCRQARDDFAQVSRCLRAASQGPVPAPRLDVLRQRVAEAAREKVVIVRILRRVAAAAAAALVTATLLLAFKGEESPAGLAERSRLVHDDVMEIVLSGPVWGSDF